MSNNTLTSIIDIANYVAKDGERYIFGYFSKEINDDALHYCLASDLAELHPDLPAAADYYTNLNGYLHVQPAESLALTLYHWKNSNDVLNIGGSDYLTLPYEIVPSKRHNNCYLVTSDLYNMMTLPSGLKVAFSRLIGNQALQSRDWLIKNYPYVTDKIHLLDMVDDFTPREMAKFLFGKEHANTPTVDMMAVSFNL